MVGLRDFRKKHLSRPSSSGKRKQSCESKRSCMAVFLCLEGHNYLSKRNVKLMRLPVIKTTHMNIPYSLARFTIGIGKLDADEPCQKSLIIVDYQVRGKYDDAAEFFQAYQELATHRIDCLFRTLRDHLSDTWIAMNRPRQKTAQHLHSLQQGKSP